GEGAESGDVFITNKGLIETTGHSSDGILAQAIGGGGGLGGSTRTIGFQISGSKGDTQNTMTLSFGGKGGEGAIGGRVFVENTGRILTSGQSAYGIRAQSIGGGGGIGGSAVAASIQGSADSNAIELNVGGFGGEGGRGDLVDVTNTGLIYTKGDFAAGISANSIGGGGGEGGLVFSLTAIAAPEKDAHRLVTNIGGSGGDGGTGGSVIVRNKPADPADELSGLIMTEGKQAYGILAQSIGGGGGRGSSVINIQGGATSRYSTVLGFSLGGQGGDGNKGGQVDVVNEGVIYTKGDDAYGILAQSIGGGGGNGGMAVTVNAIVNPDLNLTENPLQSPMASIGGFGGDGGGGGLVQVSNSGTILTTGRNAHGIVAQSIGGGGGNANVGFGIGGLSASGGVSTVLSNAIAFGLGNLGGGSGGKGGEVKVEHSGDITVLGDGAVAIKAESINGGGGSLVMDLAGIVGLPGIPYVGKVGLTPREDPLIGFRVGAIGATGMNASKVTVNSTGTFQTAGDHAIVDATQSLAGGGGTTIMNVDLADFHAEMGAKAMAFEVVLGGMNGTDNVAADISSIHTGHLTSFGDLSTGVLAQAIGGGGGRGVFNITTEHDATMDTVSIGLGAANTTGESAGKIIRRTSGAVTTVGTKSFGSVLQSIGGGGGSAIVNLGVANEGLNLTLGANGGSGANGNAIDATYDGGSQTTGAGAVGLLMQSIGAGGGEVRANGADQTTVTLGGRGGVSGDAGDIDLLHSGPVYTAGRMAHGVILQSIGGGGGAVFGTGADTRVNLSSDNTGNGGAIAFTQNGHTVVAGDDTYGLIAQSLGGGGGWVDGAHMGAAGGRGAGGDIDLTFNGIVYATGTNSTAVFAQSQGRDGAGQINLDLTDAVRGGSGTGVGVSLMGGADNLVTIRNSLSAVSGLAIRATSGDDRVVNNGFVAGNVELGGGDNRFMNSQDASFLAFDRILLRDTQIGARSASLVPQRVSASAQAVAGGEATFTNAGLFRVGLEAPAWSIDLANGEVYDNLDRIAAAAENVYYGARVITEVDLDGHFVQTDTGRSVFDVAFGPYASDRVNVSGDAIVGGQLSINLLWLENVDRVTLFATGGEGIVTAADPAGTLALDFRLVGDNAGVHLELDSHFGLGFMRPNEQRLGGHLDSALQEGGASGIGRLMSALGNMVAGQEDLYNAIFHDLNPEGHVAALQTQYLGATRFADRMFGCGLGRDTALERCVWGVGSTTAFDQEETGQYWGTTSRIYNARFGIERRLDAEWTLAASAGYNSLARQTVDGGRMNTQGDGFDVGVGLKREWAEGTDLSLTASAGWQWLESQRYGYVFDAMTGRSTGENGYMQVGGELGHTVRAGAFFLRPAVNVLATALRNGDFEESGWGGMGARVLGDTQWIASVETKVTTGWTFRATENVKADFALTAGRVHRSEDGIALPVQMIGASTSSDPAMITTPLDRSAWKLGLEARVVTRDGVSFQAGYDGQLGDKADVHTGSVSVRWTF
ncbi:MULTISPECIES: autotransporter outer membrane beta-barrel domain-containing protein, partial [unclassified Brevundimonas]|uniref:autotransporter outer membrane beta-barrel domain-containing protein n=1 Tax=Brevundimonas sp. UBA5866 TaxID=1946132 RepID=UPI0025BE3BB1